MPRSRTGIGRNNGSVPGGADMADPRHWPADLPPTASEAIAFLDNAYR
jgi:hypothetical protein